MRERGSGRRTEKLSDFNQLQPHLKYLHVSTSPRLFHEASHSHRKVSLSLSIPLLRVTHYSGFRCKLL